MWEKQPDRFDREVLDFLAASWDDADVRHPSRTTAG